MFFNYSHQNHQRLLRERQVLENQQAAAIANAVPNNPLDDDAPNENAHSQESASNAENTTPDPANEDLVDSEIISSTTTAEIEDNNRLPTVALLRTFVLSFFASLIPETPAV